MVSVVHSLRYSCGNRYPACLGNATVRILVMPAIRDNAYIWVTWLTRLLSGENSGEWAAWFRANHEGWSYEKVSSDFDSTTWQLNHTTLLNHILSELEEEERKTVFTENLNSFFLRGSLG
jgi:hypothetical protein